MTIERGSVPGAVAVALIAVVNWAGPRWSEEGRLFARIRVLGQAHAALPDSSKRATLGITLTALARDLNAWDARPISAKSVDGASGLRSQHWGSPSQL